MMGSPCFTLSRIAVLLMSISGVWSMLTFLGKRKKTEYGHDEDTPLYDNE